MLIYGPVSSPAFFFAASPASSPKFQRDGVIRELSAVDMNVEEKREGKRKNT